TLKDFIWWSGLSAGEARAGFEDIKSRLVSETAGKTVYWMSPDISLPEDKAGAFALPGFDEYILGYQDRSAVLDAQHAEKICPGNNGMFASTILIEGKVIGTWKRTIKKNSVAITAVPFTKLSKAKQGAFQQAAERYAEFMGLPAAVI
ncbi:MAG: crosslink repair DNA glycosylase YcaQ family protein, partial [Gallionella sp.]|nr:crosslink repair DNA glycosylase YcaQ family protein [Gallionella sp.]